ncbi:MAG TPA: serine/threonine-protein kinase [Kofleriaceae bacterium]|nr:serine/threonine-protein kinase [Kofleriaceae bacterium]
MSAPEPGRLLGKYQLIAELARGGMAIVYLALVQGPGGFTKLVVVKELKPELIEEPAFLTMFLDEARLAAKLSHANIVQTNEVGNDGKRTFMAMDYLDGRGLDRVRRRARASGQDLSLPIHLRILCDMLAGLHHAHTLTDFDGTALAIVHRDVSPQNVFVTFDGQVKLLDFGIAKAADSLNETRVGVLKGKVSYMSPEQARGQKVDARADVFSAGVMLWEALTGRKLREGQNDQQMLWALASGDLPRASSIKPWVPPELDAICARAMAWDRDHRYPSAGELQHEIEHYLAVTGTSVASREVGLCVSELFREDRVTINAMIESHLARGRGEPEALPILDVSARGFTPSYQGEQRRGSGPFTVPQLAASLDEPGSQAGDAPSHSRSREVPRPAPGALRRRVPVIAAAAAGTLIASVIICVGRTGNDAAPSGERVRAELQVAAPPAPLAAPVVSEPGAAAPPASPAPAPAPAFVTVKVRVSPDNATITIDGAHVTGNPFSGKYVADGAIHQVRATAPGYVPQIEAVEFTGKVTVNLSLARDVGPRIPPIASPVAAHPVRPPPVRPPDHAESAMPPPRAEPAIAAEPRESRDKEPRDKEPRTLTDTDVNPAGGTAPQRPIDRNDPYGGGP